MRANALVNCYPHPITSDYSGRTWGIFSVRKPCLACLAGEYTHRLQITQSESDLQYFFLHEMMFSRIFSF